MKHIAVALIQGAGGAGKSSLVDAQFARRGTRRMARISVRSPADMGIEIGRLAAVSRVDHVIVEVGDGVGHGASGRRMLEPPQPDTCAITLEYACTACVVDSTSFLRDLVTEVHVLEGGSVRVESHAMALARQVEASEVIVVSKADLKSRADLRVLLAVLHELNPTAHVVFAQHGHAPSLDLFDRSHIELAGALRGVARNDVLDPSAHERAQAGISSYVYRARRPFHPGRLHAHIHQVWPGVLRSRGLVWLATRMDEAGVWSQAGSLWEMSRGGFWLAASGTSGTDLPRSAERAEWQEPFGDRRQELTLIGLELDTRALTDAFDACLLSPDELAAGADEWRGLPDPFAAWTGSTMEKGHAPQPRVRQPSSLE